MRAANHNSPWSNPLSEGLHLKRDRQNGTSYQPSIGPPFESGHGLLRTTSDHLATVQSRLIKVQNQIKSPIFDKLEAYGALNIAIAETDKVKRELAAKLSALLIKHQDQMLVQNAANSSLEEKLTKARLMTIRGNASSSQEQLPQASPEQSDSASSIKLTRLLEILDLDSSLASKDIFIIESAVRQQIVSLLERERQGVETDFEDLSRRQLEAERECHEATLQTLEQRVATIEDEYRQKLESWKSAAADKGQRLLALQADLAAAEAKNEEAAAVAEARYSQIVEDLNADVQELTEKLTQAQSQLNLNTKELEVRVAEQAQQLKETREIARAEVEAQWQQRLAQVESNLAWTVRDLEGRLQASEKAKAELAEKCKDLQSSIHRLEDTQREEINKIKDQLLADGANKLESVAEGLKEKEASAVQPYVDRILQLEDAVKDLHLENTNATKTFRAKLEEVQIELNRVIGENEAYKLDFEKAVRDKDNLDFILNTRIDELTRDLKQSQSNLTAKDKSLEDLRKAKDELERSYQQSVSRFEQRISEIQSEKSKESQLMESERSTVDGLKTRLISQEEEIERLEGALDKQKEIRLQEVSIFAKEKVSLTEELSGLRNTIAVLEEKLKDSEKNAADALQQAAEMQASVETLSKNTMTLNQIISSHEKQLKETQTECNRFKDELEQSAALIKEKENDISELRGLAERVRSQYEVKILGIQKEEEQRVRDLTAKIEAELALKIERADELESQLFESVALRRQQADELAEQKSLVQELHSRIATLDSERVETQRRHLEAMEKQMNALAESRKSEAEAVEAIQEAETSKLLLAKQLEVERCQTVSLFERIDKLTLAVENANKSADAETDRLKAELALKIERADELESQLFESVALRRQQADELAEQKSLVHELHSRIATLDSERYGALATVETQRRDLEAIEKQMKALAESRKSEAEAFEAIHEAEAANLLLAKELQDEKSEVASLRQRIEQLNVDLENSKKSADAETDRVKAELAEKKKALSVAQETLTHQSEDVAAQLAQIKESEDMIKNIQETVWKEREFLDEKNATIHSLEETNSALEKRIQELENEANELRLQVDQIKISKDVGSENESPKQGSLLGNEFQRPTDALLSSPVMGGNKSGLKTLFTNSFDLDEGLDKSFDMKDSLMVPPRTPEECRPSADSNDDISKLNQRVRQLERQNKYESQEAEELRNKVMELESRAQRLQSELGRTSSEKTAVENLLYQVGLEKKTKIKKLIAQIEAVEAQQEETLKKIKLEFEHQKNLDLQKLERDLKEKYEAILENLKSQAALSPIKDTGMAVNLNKDDRKNSWLESEDESEELESFDVKISDSKPDTFKISRMYESPSKGLGESQLFQKEVETGTGYIPTRSPEKPQTEGDRRIANQPARQSDDKRGKKYQDSDYQFKAKETREPKDSAYFVKKAETSKDSPKPRHAKKQEPDHNSERNSTGADNRKSKGSRLSHHPDNPYIKKSETLEEPAFVVKENSRLTSSSYVEKKVAKTGPFSPAKTESASPSKQESPARKENKDSSKQEAPKLENESEIQKSIVESSKGPMLLSDLLSPEDFEQENDETEWFGFNEKGKANPVKEGDCASLKDDARSELSHSLVMQKSLKEVAPNKDFDDNKSQVSSKMDQPTEERLTHDSMIWSAVLKDDDFDKYYNDDNDEQTEMRDSIVDQPLKVEDEMMSSEKKKKKKKKAKVEMDLRLISPKLN